MFALYRRFIEVDPMLHETSRREPSLTSGRTTVETSIHCHLTTDKVSDLVHALVNKISSTADNRPVKLLFGVCGNECM